MLPCSNRFYLAMMEAELGLAQNMKVVENDILYLSTKFQLNFSTVTHEMAKIPLIAIGRVLWTVLTFHHSGRIFSP